MRRPSRTGLSWVFVLLANFPSIAQNLESIGKEKPLSFAGGLSFNQIFYSSDGSTSRRDPYSYFASGNLNLSLYGWSIPLSFSVSNRSTTFSQPFNQYSLHPTWKWITAHAGYTSMSFSPYTVNGHIFSGFGIELSPEGNWKVSALYGKFLRAVEADTTETQSFLPAYQRKGYGLKATYGNARNFIDLIVFRAEDEEHSIRPLPDSLKITPQENLVLSFAGGKSLFKHFLLKAELAASAITKDTRSETHDHDHLLATFPQLLQPRLSTAFYHAFKTSFDYQRNDWTLGLAYERIDPGYRTLGAYYFNNDLENITLNGTTRLLDEKINIAVSGGIQQDNLDNNKVSTMRRMVGSMNINYMTSRCLNISASWSSFQTYTNIRSRFETINELTPYDNLDTLNFTQISRNASLSGVYTLPGPEKNAQSISINISWQDAADKQGEVQQHSGTHFFNINTGYSLTLVPRNMSVALTFNTTVNQGPFMTSRMMGPNASFSKSFFNRKLRTTLSSSYNKTHGNNTTINAVMNSRVNCALTLHNKHNINLSTVLVKRSSEARTQSVTEFTATLGYNYSFGSKRK